MRVKDRKPDGVDPWAETYNKIYYLFKSLTTEDQIQWLEVLIADYFEKKKLPIALAVSSKSKATRRSSVLCYAVKKGTNHVKEMCKALENDKFGCHVHA